MNFLNRGDLLHSHRGKRGIRRIVTMPPSRVGIEVDYNLMSLNTWPLASTR